MELIINIFSLVGSLALFLFGMKTMSEGLEKFAGDRLRSILAAMTKNRVMGVLTGILITALIQSSSATTVMVVSFVGCQHWYNSDSVDNLSRRIQGKYCGICHSPAGHRNAIDIQQ